MATETQVDQDAVVPRKLMGRAAAGELKVEEDSGEIHDATEWLLGAVSDTEDITHVLTLNVGSHAKQHKINWTIKALDGAVIRRIREEAAGNRAARRQGGASLLADSNRAFQANVKVVVEGTVKPDLKAVAAQRGLAAATLLIEEGFRRKQGMVDQVAAEIMALSGYDDDDVQDAVEQGAAGSSFG